MPCPCTDWAPAASEHARRMKSRASRGRCLSSPLCPPLPPINNASRLVPPQPSIGYWLPPRQEQERRSLAQTDTVTLTAWFPRPTTTTTVTTSYRSSPPPITTSPSALPSTPHPASEPVDHRIGSVKLVHPEIGPSCNAKGSASNLIQLYAHSCGDCELTRAQRASTQPSSVPRIWSWGMLVAQPRQLQGHILIRVAGY
jgi:hypothetical protein